MTSAEPTPLETLTTSIQTRAAQMRQAAAVDQARAGAATDLSRLFSEAVVPALLAQAEAGELVERFKSAMELAHKRELGGDAQLTAAVYALLEEHTRRSVRWLAEKGEAWRADAYRAEGAAGELVRVEAALASLAAAGPQEANGGGDGGSEASLPEVAQAEPTEAPPGAAEGEGREEG